MRTRIGVVILARMSSSRFPGKVIAPLGGIPVLEILTRRLLQGGFTGEEIVVATSEHPSDDALAEFCAKKYINCYRGDLKNVLERFVNASRFYDFDFSFRVNADSPFVSVALLKHAMKECEDQPSVDVITNVRRRFWPYGIACELINIRSAERLLATVPEMRDGQPTGYREHITSAFYASHEDFNVVDLIPSDNVSDFTQSPALTVDEPEDVVRLERLLAQCNSDPLTFTYENLV
ncbi:3-deoxy-manno-octulosonate cytidylyltransferase CMP-KDO synthetase protein [Salinisphaera shabanensis E1L3A]|uniref:3-deoxy-manno-octulosonate cytidylyltransferase CMP-KDO synthetase protein n=2 Tax=Salinisphaera shabanensis TaxID=180542 RepID=U2FMX2_9GAMM|nr:NTP transferase domain-containing protein [Salinisphaera shabanensis]ERJ17544.1 3-deoxy-manno-octulosonate cytidylyltransferase CMP-KDO synthetase protein [Salinisphaera shabanensis E1L3A]